MTFLKFILLVGPLVDREAAAGGVKLVDGVMETTAVGAAV